MKDNSLGTLLSAQTWKVLERFFLSGLFLFANLGRFLGFPRSSKNEVGTKQHWYKTKGTDTS